MTSKLDKRGGARQNAGRKPAENPKRPITLRLSKMFLDKCSKKFETISERNKWINSVLEKNI